MVKSCAKILLQIICSQIPLFIERPVAEANQHTTVLSFPFSFLRFHTLVRQINPLLQNNLFFFLLPQKAQITSLNLSLLNFMWHIILSLFDLQLNCISIEINPDFLPRSSSVCAKLQLPIRNKNGTVHTRVCT